MQARPEIGRGSTISLPILHLTFSPVLTLAPGLTSIIPVLSYAREYRRRRQALR